VPGKLAVVKGKPLLTAKSLSANPVYHNFDCIFGLAASRLPVEQFSNDLTLRLPIDRRRVPQWFLHA
jgi:hypothetical protein